MESKRKILFVNATACTKGGALSILRQLLHTLFEHGQHLHTIVFCGQGLEEFSCGHIKIIEKNHNLKWVQRIFWDIYGLAKWAKKNEVKPDIILSMQNTGIGGFPSIPQVVYLHQPIPFSNDIEWELNKAEWKMLFYKHVYKQLIKYSVPSNAHIIVQTEWMKQAVIKKLAVREDYVHKFTPEIANIDSDRIIAKQENKKVFFYPTSNFSYKNTNLLYDVAGWLLQNNPETLEKIVIVLTFECDKKLADELARRGIIGVFKFTGYISYEEVLAWYKCSHAVLFPSLLETFGMPLVEAAQMGKKILASDLPYAREVCGDCEGVEFILPKDIVMWATAIKQAVEEDVCRYLPAKYVDRKNGWQDMLKLIYSIS